MRNILAGLVMLGAVSCTDALALSPVTLIHNDAAEVTRSTRTVADRVLHVVCVRRPPPGADYLPGKLHVRLIGTRPIRSLPDPATRRLDDGRECFAVALLADNAANYVVSIYDQTAAEPWQSFYSGPFADIPAAK